jgi:hypothetical protein
VIIVEIQCVSWIVSDLDILVCSDVCLQCALDRKAVESRRNATRAVECAKALRLANLSGSAARSVKAKFLGRRAARACVFDSLVHSLVFYFI